jgi:hypothetical protein
MELDRGSGAIDYALAGKLIRERLPALAGG